MPVCSVVRASELELGGSWVWFPRGARKLFLSFLWLNSLSSLELVVFENSRFAYPRVNDQNDNLRFWFQKTPLRVDNGVKREEKCPFLKLKYADTYKRDLNESCTINLPSWRITFVMLYYPCHTARCLSWSPTHVDNKLRKWKFNWYWCSWSLKNELIFTPF